MKSALLLIGLLVTTSVISAEKIYLDRLVNTNICHHCNLIDADLHGQDFSAADMSEALLKRINLSQTKLVGAWFTHSRLQDANFEGADLSTALMDNANFTGANLKGTNLTDAKLNFSDLTNVDLTDATMDNTVLRGVIFCNTTMPDGRINNDGCPSPTK